MCRFKKQCVGLVSGSNHFCTATYAGCLLSMWSCSLSSRCLFSRALEKCVAALCVWCSSLSWALVLCLSSLWTPRTCFCICCALRRHTHTHTHWGFQTKMDSLQARTPLQRKWKHFGPTFDSSYLQLLTRKGSLISGCLSHVCVCVGNVFLFAKNKSKWRWDYSGFFLLSFPVLTVLPLSLDHKQLWCETVVPPVYSSEV